jgi:hypothetical protein
LAACEPAIMPALTWKDVAPRNRFFRSKELYTQIYGWPVDAQLWEPSNPASIAKAKANTIRESGLQIYLECGDEDYLNLQEGAEFLHQVAGRHQRCELCRMPPDASVRRPEA